MGAVVAQKFIQFQGQSSALLIEMQNKDKEIADKLTEMKESDLSRISQFLHDNIGAEISALRLHIEKLTGEQSDCVNKEAWQKIVERTGKIADEIRKTSHQLSPSMLQQFGLMASIEHYIADVNESKKINIQFDHQGDCHLIQQKRAILILQIIHELTQNTIKHSDSKNMIIQLFCHENDSIELVVEDDGKGFDTKKTFIGLGLNQLQQIVTLSGGSFKIQSAINEGTTVNIELPKT
jgi:signal transduction histidine kinase